MINKIEKDIFDLEAIAYEGNDSIYATRAELNDEALIRARSDEAITNNLNIAIETQNKKIERIKNRLNQESVRINDFKNQLIALEKKVQNNQDRINEISSSFFWFKLTF